MWGLPLPARFHNRSTELVARDLLGAVLHCTTADGVTVARVVETEAYLGPDDPACHAVAGLTPRTVHLVGPPGMSYVYFIYVRRDRDLTNGPGKLEWPLRFFVRDDPYVSATPSHFPRRPYYRQPER